MLTTYSRVMEAYRRKVRLEAQLSYRESDRRAPNEEYTWTRWRGVVQAQRQAMKETVRYEGGME